MRVLLVATLLVTGCVEREAADPGEVMREETVTRTAPRSVVSSRAIRCSCSSDGLRIRAPEGSQVTIPEDATADAEAEIFLPEEEPAQPIRRTKSLGFIGDGPITGSVSRGGPWNAPDALMPPHEHGVDGYATSGGYAYYGSSSGTYGGGSGYRTHGRSGSSSSGHHRSAR